MAAGIEEAIAGLDQVPKSDLQSAIDTSVQRIHALEKTLTEKISILPPYDARMCVEVRWSALVQVLLLFLRVLKLMCKR